MEYFESCSSSLKPSHVYISFLGDEDTRNFIRSLSAALKAEGFRIYGDDKKLEKPDSNSNLPHHLVEAIHESWIRIVVLSKNYASSCWCLQELKQFVRCYCDSQLKPKCEDKSVDIFNPEADIEKVNKWRLVLKRGFRLLSIRRSAGDMIIPVFYDDDVDPKSFAQLIQQICTPEGLFQGRRCYYYWSEEEIIKQVATLSGWDIRNDSRSQVIEKIVKQVKSKIDKLFYDYFGFVGIQSQVEEVEKLLDLRTDDDVVRVVGICGMGGLGKSSIATVLYLKIFHYFDAFCFLSNVSLRLKHGDLSLQQLLLRHMSTENSEMMNFLDKEFLACERLRKHKFLIVLDGVDVAQHLQELNLLENSNCFGGGSRIIITTRNEQVLQNYEIDTIYRPRLLSEDEGFKLFCSEAFPWKYPVTDFEEMILRVLEYAKGLPLAIKTLGSSLFGKEFAEWRNFLDREEIIPPYEIIRVLRKSFDELDKLSREMFLDIACFFVGKEINYVKEILHDCFSYCVDMELLVKKSLVTITNQRIQLHHVLQAMGREIVRRQSPYVREARSRLYLFNDIKHVMESKRNMVIYHVEAIALDLEEPKRVTLRIDALSYMINLRLLIFRNVNFSGTLNNLSNKLQYVSWHQYPFTSLPTSFQSDTLVHLIMPESSMTEVWKGKVMLPKLRKMDLCGSKNLITTPAFGGVPNLERLELEGCTRLLKLDASIAKLSNLKFVNLRGCINLISIPNSLFSQNSLEVLNLVGCSKLAHCLNFSPIKSFIQVKMLGIWDIPFLEKVLCFLLLVLPQQKSYHDFVCCLLIYFMCVCEVTYA